MGKPARRLADPRPDKVPVIYGGPHVPVGAVVRPADHRIGEVHQVEVVATAHLGSDCWLDCLDLANTYRHFEALTARPVAIGARGSVECKVLRGYRDARWVFTPAAAPIVALPGPSPATSGRSGFTRAAWLAEGTRLFGRDPSLWAFECPVCLHSATVAAYRSAGAPEAAIGRTCLGLWSDGPRRPGPFPPVLQPCFYDGSDLGGFYPALAIHQADGSIRHLFRFAPGARP